MLLEEFIDDFQEDELENPKEESNDKVEQAYGVYIVSPNVTTFIQSIERCAPEQAARKVRIAENSIIGIRNARIFFAQFVLDENGKNTIDYYPYDESESYKKVKGTSYSTYVKFDLAVDAKKKKVELMTQALVSVYRLALDVYHKIIGIPYPQKVSESFRLGTLYSDDMKEFDGKMYMLLKRYDYLPDEMLEKLQYNLREFFHIDFPMKTIRDTFGSTQNTRLLRSSIISGLDRNMLRCLEASVMINDNTLIVKLKEGCELCLDEIHVASLGQVDKCSNVVLDVDGTLVIKSVEGYSNLNQIDRRYRNNRLIVKTRITPYIIDWILTHLSFEEIDLSEAKTVGQIEIHTEDVNVRNKKVKVIPGENIIVEK